jgi:hypothetical protein
LDPDRYRQHQRRPALAPARCLIPDKSTRVLHFPSGRSLGWVKIPCAGPDPHDNWDLAGDATGDVAIPPATPVRLMVEDKAAADLAPLGALSPDDLQQLYLVQTEVTDDQLVHIARLTGLEVLTLGLTEVSDTGLALLRPLQRLRRLYLNATCVSDRGLVHLRAFPHLESLSLGGSLVTDAGLHHLYGPRRLRWLSLDDAYAER